MDKKILFLILGCLFISVNSYALNGDFIVEGNLNVGGTDRFNVDGSTGDIAIGTSPTAARLINMAGTDKIGIYVNLTRQSTSLAPMGFGVSDELDGSFAFGFPSAIFNVTDDLSGKSVSGTYNILDVNGSLNVANYAIRLGNNVAGTLNANASDSYVALQRLATGTRGNSQRTVNILNYYGTVFESTDNANAGSPGIVTLTNNKQIYVKNFASGAALVTNNLVGLQIDKQTAGTVSNAGLVLNGDGAGSDIVFGSAQQARIYGNAGNLVVDTSGKFGVGTTTPTEKLEVAGAIKVGDSSSSQCNQSNAGTIKFVSPNFLGCNGSTWVQLNNN